MPCEVKRHCPPFVRSPEFNNFVLMCAAFHVQPSHAAQDLLAEELPAHVSARDWYAFDIAATMQAHRLVAQASSDTPMPLVQENASGVGLRGNETPPWKKR